MKKLLLASAMSLAGLMLGPVGQAKSQQIVVICVKLSNGSCVPVDTNNPLPTTSSGGGGSNAAAGPTGSAPPGSASYSGFNISNVFRGQTGYNPSGTIYSGAVDLTSLGGTSICVGAGAAGSCSIRTTVAQDATTIAGSAPGVAGTPSANVLSVQGVSGGTGLPITSIDGGIVGIGSLADSAWVSGNGSLIALGKAIVGQLGTLNTTAAAAQTAGTNTIGGTIPRADTTSGVTAYGLQTAAATNSTLVSTGAHTLYGMNLESTSTTVMYLRMYDSAGAPTCSSATGFQRSWPIPPAASSGLVGGIAVHLPIQGIKFANGLSFCVTGGVGSTDNTNATTGGIVNLDYQ